MSEDYNFKVAELRTNDGLLSKVKIRAGYTHSLKVWDTVDGIKFSWIHFSFHRTLAAAKQAEKDALAEYT